MGGSNATITNSCVQYDPASDTWSSFPSFIDPRERFGAAVVLNKIYIAGGDYGFTLNSVEVFDGTNWISLSSSLNLTRAFCAAVMFQNKFVVLGGDQTTIEVFDPAMSTWNRTFPAMKTSQRKSLAAISF